MRRNWIAVLMMPLLLLAGCRSGEINELQTPMDFRTSLIHAGGCRFTAQMRADVGGTLYDLLMLCEVFTDGSAAMTVQEPETLEGVRAELRGTDGSLLFDDVSFDLGQFPQSELAPIEVPVVTVDGWQNAYIASAGGEEGQLHVCYEGSYQNTSYVLDTWFDREGIPVQSEISLNGAVVAVMKMRDFTWNGE